jgi:pyruvate dehydrogenase E1 component
MRDNFEAPDQIIDQLVDTDPSETAEWHASFDAALEHAGPVRARYLMLSLLKRAHEKNIGVSALRTTDYINTISPENEPDFPGDESIERRIRAFNRWNAAMLVHRAQRPGVGVGGHISTYASSAALYEVGFNHFFRGQDHPGGGDQIFFQGHASPGMYARAFLEGRFSENQLDGFRQELSHPGWAFFISSSTFDARFLAIPNCVNGYWSTQCNLSSTFQSIHAQSWNQRYKPATCMGIPWRW